MKQLDTIFRNTLKITYYASIVPLMILVVLIVLDVGARYILNSAVPSGLEISQLLLSILISLSLGYTTYVKDNFAVEFVIEKLPKTVQNIMNMVSCCIASGVCFILTSQAIKEAIYSTKGKEFAGSLELPVYPTKWVFALGFLLTAIVLLVQIFEASRKGKSDSGEVSDYVFSNKE